MFQELLKSKCHVVNDPCVVRGGLVIHGPSTADELQPALGHQIADQVLHLVSLLVPPAPEERGLHLDESARNSRESGFDKYRSIYYYYRLFLSRASSLMTESRMYWTPALWISILSP